MPEIVSANGIIGLLLAIVGVMLLRILKSVDRSADALPKQDKEIAELRMMLSTQEKELRRMAKEFELARNRYHDLANKVQVLYSRRQLSEKNSERDDA